MRAVLCTVFVGASACSFSPNVGVDRTDAAPADSKLPDAPAPDSAPCVTFSTLFDTCALSGPRSDLVIIGSATYSTDTHMLVSIVGTVRLPTHALVTTPSGPIDVLVVNNFTLTAGATLRVTGTVPFGIAAFGNVTVAGVIDMSAGGAGARTATACGSSQGANGINNIGGASGAGGGGYHGVGGRGGMGDNNGDQSPGGPGGSMINRPAGLIGGCSGGRGGDGQVLTGGNGGAGGGAVVIATPQTIAITGAIDAGGGGGSGGKVVNGGGGGGGSGGMVLLECQMLSQTSIIVANGGGGGEGGFDQVGVDGAAGTRTLTRAKGGETVVQDGNGAGNGGEGGAGAAHSGLRSPTFGDGGGGGGGGSTGYIAIACPPFANTGIISPTFALWP